MDSRTVTGASLALVLALVLVLGCGCSSAYERGLAALERGQAERAIELFDVALRERPTRAEILRQKSRALSTLGRETEALIERARAEDIWLAARPVEMRPESPEAWFHLGVMFTGQGIAEAALPCFERAAAMEPDNAEYQFQRGVYLAANGWVDEGLSIVDLAIRLDPEQTKFHTRRGAILGEAGRFDEALAAFDRAAVPSFEKASVLMKMGRIEDALVVLEALAATTNAQAVHRERGRCLHLLGRYEEALATYDLAARFGAYGQPIDPESINPEGKLARYREETRAALGLSRR